MFPPCYHIFLPTPVLSPNTRTMRFRSSLFAKSSAVSAPSQNCLSKGAAFFQEQQRQCTVAKLIPMSGYTSRSMDMRDLAAPMPGFGWPPLAPSPRSFEYSIVLEIRAALYKQSHSLLLAGLNQAAISELPPLHNRFEGPSVPRKLDIFKIGHC